MTGEVDASYLTGPLPRPAAGTDDDVVLHVYAGSDQGLARHHALDAWNNTRDHTLHRVKALYHDVGSTADQQRDNLEIALDPKSSTQVDVVVMDNPDVHSSPT